MFETFTCPETGLMFTVADPEQRLIRSMDERTADKRELRALCRHCGQLHIVVRDEA